MLLQGNVIRISVTSVTFSDGFSSYAASYVHVSNICCVFLWPILLVSFLVERGLEWLSGDSTRLPSMWPGFDSGPVPYVL